MSTIGRLLAYTGGHKTRMLLALCLALGGVVVDLLRPWPVKIVVDHVLAARPLPEEWRGWADLWPWADTPAGLIVGSVVASVIIAGAGAGLSLAVLSVGISACQTVLFTMLRDVYEKLQRLSLAYHGRQRVGELLQRLSGDVLVVFLAVTQVALPAIISSLAIIGMAVVMLRIDVGLSLVALSVIPLLMGNILLFARPLQTSSTRQYESQGMLMAMLEQGLSGIKVIQGYAREDYIQQKVEAQAQELTQAGAVAMKTTAANSQSTAMITGLVSALVLGVGSHQALAERITPGDLLVFLGYVAALTVPVTGLSTAVAYGVIVCARSRRIFEILDSAEVVPERPDARSLGRVRGAVVFESVTFRYSGDSPEAGARTVLEDVSFRVEPGQVVAVVGATGAGKSSLVSLLSRFYDPERGRIQIDGVDLRDVSLRSLRENIALVLQEAFLFPMSVAENIAFGRPGATREEIIGAARAAYAHDFIEALPQGYDTLIAERGKNLSGGERQRIAIAQALLKNAPILILDEPTSALDARTEAQIFNALDALMRGRTTFIISHRLSTVRRADLILTLDEGRLVEHGTHDALLRLGDIYADLYRYQNPVTAEARR